MSTLNPRDSRGEGTIVQERKKSQNSIASIEESKAEEAQPDLTASASGVYSLEHGDSLLTGIKNIE